MRHVRYAWSHTRADIRLRYLGVVHYGHRYGGSWCYSTWAAGDDIDAPIPVTCFWCLTGLQCR